MDAIYKLLKESGLNNCSCIGYNKDSVTVMNYNLNDKIVIRVSTLLKENYSSVTTEVVGDGHDLRFKFSDITPDSIASRILKGEI